ncbi:(S)-N-methylcoclaurine 3'-hydroxylase isozyme [Thalictrum thalictroides]|uniref:(S)-N-methylcoclaurine 3'-hydroxylase isozyme n=1 Tax=Thalictrum thalictroides TaxID=46969 RepID=A0A7J6V5U4_THATH|nr:(S)-N-methylcoclaurine 3'-hydroxylase isozyme [Thalictrum thalictroides]
MLDVLLANDFNDAQINALFLETFGPGSETSSATIEWVMSELIKNPKEMAKVRKELDEVVGASTVKESHLPQLPYLQAYGKRPEELELKEILSLSLAIDPSLRVVPKMRA